METFAPFSLRECPRNLSHPSLQQCIQLQSVPALCNQYFEVLDWIQQYHAESFPTYRHQFQQQNRKPRSAFQPSWTQIVSNISKTASTSHPSKIIEATKSTPKPLLLGKTRLYRSRSLVPGFCNHERTFAQAYKKDPIKPTPTELYKLPNVNRDDRYFIGSNQTIRIFQFTQTEWIQHAKECLKTSTSKFNRCEPLITYIRYVMSLNDNKTSTGNEPEPNIFGPKLTNEQKQELLDAHYWIHLGRPANTASIKHDYKTVLFYYKMFGWFVRTKDGYRSTKSHDMRQLIIKRNELINKGSISLQVRPTVNPNRLKSSRGRKRKSNVSTV